MATTHIHRSPSQRAYERRQEQTSYGAMWAIVVLAILASIAFGYFGTPNGTLDGSTSSMVGTGAASNELTPSVVTPGSPDTTTTESSRVPVDGTP